MNEIVEEYIQTNMFNKLNNIKYTYKSSNLIMSSYDLSLTEHRIITLGCKKIKPIYVEKRISPKDLENVLTAMKFTNIEISVSEYKKEFKIKSNNVYDTLEQYSNILYERSINYFDELNRLTKKRWIDECKFDRRNGKIILTFNIKMIPDLLVLKGKYVPLYVDLLSENIKSKHIFRTYEILKSNLYNKKWKISVEEYKFLLGITDKYSQFGDLRKKIISPSIEAINKYSDILVNVEFIKTGRSVTYLNFYINSNDSTKSVFFDENDFKDSVPTAFEEINKALKKLNIELTSGEAEKLIDNAIEVTQLKHKDKNVVEYIIEKINVLENYLINNKVDNIMGYLLKAITNDWKLINANNTKKLNFNNFESRKYDYDKLEKGLLYGIDEKESNEFLNSVIE